MTSRSTRFSKGLAAVAVAALVLAACGDDDDDGAASTSGTGGTDTTAAPGTSAPPVTTAAPGTTAGSGTTAAPDTTGSADTTTAPSGDIDALDTNGDGVVQFGVAVAGPRDDGAYYQALVTKVEEFSEANGFEAADHRRQHHRRGRRHRVDQYRRAGCRRDHGRRQRDRRSARRSRRAVPRHLLVLQLWRRLPREPRSRPEPGRRLGDQLHGRVCHRASAPGQRRRQRRLPGLLRPSRSRRSRTWRSSWVSRPSIRRSR